MTKECRPSCEWMRRRTQTSQGPEPEARAGCSPWLLLRLAVPCQILDLEKGRTHEMEAPGTRDSVRGHTLRAFSGPVVRPITLGTDPCAEHSLSNKQVVERAWRLVEWKVYLASTGRHGELDSRYTELNPRGQTRMPNLALIAVAGVYTCQRPGDGRRLALEGQASESIW